jgi:uncharacterized zinc-type alcohol dehydrogenase-like protein
MQTRTYASHGPDQPLVPFTLSRRPLGERDVQVAIDYCGICHSDIHFARNEWGFTTYPCVPGHEIIGRVVTAGASVTRLTPGQRVGVGCFVDSCNRCAPCRSGHENYCETGVTMTYGSMEPDGITPTYGGYATQIVVNEHFVFTVPDALDAAAAAPLLCAGITTYTPLREAGIAAGARAAVMGLGGLGHMAVKLAASFGAEVAVLSRSPEKEDDARRLGANDFVLTRTADPLETLAGRYDAIVDTISARHDLTGPLTWLKPGGTLMLVGAAPEPLEFSAMPLLFGGRRIVGSLVGGVPDTQAMLDHCGRHSIVSDIELIAPEQINTAYERTLRGDVKYRFVIDCSKL